MTTRWDPELPLNEYPFNTGRYDGGIIFEDVSRLPVISNEAAAWSRKLSENHAKDGEKVGLLYIVGDNINVTYNPTEYKNNAPASYLVTRLAYLSDTSCMHFWQRLVGMFNFPVKTRVFSDKQAAILWLHEKNWPKRYGGSLPDKPAS